MLKFKGFKRLIFVPLTAFACSVAPLHADVLEPGTYELPEITGSNVEEQLKDFTKIYEDTTLHVAPTTTHTEHTELDRYRVVTNKFGKNWFAFATAGAHTFRGDYSGLGKFWGTVSPDFGIGIGKWFTPGVAVKIEFIRSNSRGYTAYTTGHYGYGPIRQQEDGTPYRKMRTNWWDLSGSVIFNLSRLFLGYEGFNSPRLMNQFMFAAGIGGVHHMGYGHSYGSDNEWSGHLELQYSRFFTKAKRFSLDLKVRGLFYQTNFDLEYGQADHAANKWDSNLGVDLGFTFYLDRKRDRGWSTATSHTYTRDYSERRLREVYVMPVGTDAGASEITFYVFYPNNYSGRNDAPTIPGSKVNAIDYLTGGINTQKKYKENYEVASGLIGRRDISRLATEDIPTIPAWTDIPALDSLGICRGYEMGEGPMSLPLEEKPMTDFRAATGYFYAPIHGDKHLWHYRIDDATLDQKLIGEENYYETQPFGLNANNGLATIRENFETPAHEYLVSLADIYAALTRNEGHVAEHADPTTVEQIRKILGSSTITNVFVEGLATSQDNYTGQNAAAVGLQRNTALSNNRAATVINWLKGFDEFSKHDPKIYTVHTFDPTGMLTPGIGRVDDPSTRGLKAKLNRCVKVHIQFMQAPKSRKSKKK